MATPHKHRDEIIAWANGEEIELYVEEADEWCVIGKQTGWFEEFQYRIKPKTVKHEGWANLYRSLSGKPITGWIYPTKEEAENAMDGDEEALATVHIEWEEKQ